MRIVVDLQCCQNASRVRGIGRYALAITRALVAIGHEHDWLILLSDRFPGSVEEVRLAVDGLVAADAIRVCALPARIAAAEPADAWRCRAAEIVRAEYLATLAPDLVLIPSLFEGFHDEVTVSIDDAAHQTAVVIYDFIPLEDPPKYLPTAVDEGAYVRRARQLRRADLVLAISSYTARRAIELVRLDPYRVVMVSAGVAPQFVPPKARETDDVLFRFGIGRPFVLNTSPIEHRKNIEGLVAGFAVLPPAVRDRHQLVVVGRIDDDGRRHVAALAHAAALPPDAVVMTGHVSERELIALYGRCALFVFPSFSEGFGLPPLEAMACGAPVIASETTSLPEVIGRNDALVDPTRPECIGAAMERALTDLNWRADLIAHGLERARFFTWERTAQTTLAAFERLGERPRGRTAPLFARASRVGIVLCDQEANEILRGKAAVLASLLPPSAAIDVIGGGDASDLALDAVADRRTSEWFDDHAAKMDMILYLTAGRPDPAFERRLSVHPGPVARIVRWWCPEGAVRPSLEAEVENLPMLPVSAASGAALLWRIELGLAQDQPLAVAFASAGVAPILRQQAQQAGVRLHIVDQASLTIAADYRVLIAAADALLTGAGTTPGLCAQLRVDAHNLGIPLVEEAETITDIVERLMALRRVPQARPIAPAAAELTAWELTLAGAVEAAATTPRSLLTRVARRLPAAVSGVGPTSDDLADLASALAANHTVESPACRLFCETE